MKKGIALLSFLLVLSSICWAGGSREKDAKPQQQPRQQATQQPEHRGVSHFF
jgi:hypothetical protein